MHSVFLTFKVRWLACSYLWRVARSDEGLEFMLFISRFDTNTTVSLAYIMACVEWQMDGNSFI